jgi:NAD(P)-dependent dehydrogenase (short-subunit alcohol dehydrogenase family)
MLFKNKIALVTGASRGIGYEAALQMGAAGAQVIAISRTQGGLEKLDDAIQAAGGKPAVLVPLDLKDFAALDRLGGTLYERFGHLDILLGNGAILGPLSPISHLEPKMFEDTLATNLTANYRLIRSLDPLLKAAKAARVAFMSSGASWNTRAYWGLYGLTKAGLDALVRSYAAELADTPIKVNVFNPGPIATKMRAQAMPGEDPLTLDSPAQAASFLLKLLSEECQETGKVLDYPSKQFKSFQHPA